MPRSSVTINDLPPEIISQIVEQVDLIAQAERRSLELLARLDGGNGDLEDIMAQGPEAFTEMLRGLMGAAIGGGGGRMGGAAGAGVGGPAAAPGAAGQVNRGPFNAQHNPPPAPAAPAPAPAPTPTSAPPVFGASGVAQLGFDFSLPPFSPPPRANAGLPTNSDEEMPALEDISDTETPRPAPTTATSSAPPEQPRATIDSANYLPPAAAATPPTPVVPAPVAAPPTPAAAPRSENVDDEMPGLENIDSDSEVPELLVSIGVDEGGEEEEDEDEEDEDYDDEGNDEDYDEDDYSSDDDSPLIFPDGLPVDPLLPLLFTTRSFLHAARQKLYRKVHVASAFQASLLLHSLSAPSHAARIAAEDIEAEASGKSKNSLPLMVRTLTFDQPCEMSQGRGGAAIICDLIKLCTLVEELCVRPAFLKSSTNPFLGALSGLRRLRRIDLRSGFDPSKPFSLTTPRLFSLMRNWCELNDMTVVGLKGAEEGPSREEDDMWDYEFLEEQEDSVEEESEYEDAKDIMDKSQGDGVGRGKKREKKERPPKVKPKGLTKLALLDPDAPFTEIALLLKDSRESLKDVVLSKPTDVLTRYGLSSTVLNFFTNVTYLSLEITPSWHPKAKPVLKVPIPPRPKDYVGGKPDEDLIQKIGNYPYFLDAVVPYLPNLKTLTWDGHLASTAVFSFFPMSLKTIAWSHSPDIVPAVLAKLLKKTVNRTRSVKNADGSFWTKSIKTIVSKGLTCISVGHDDLHWSDNDLYLLEEATAERGICLHLSGGAGAGGGFGFPGAPAGGAAFPIAPIVPEAGALPGLGGLGGLLGGLPIQVLGGAAPGARAAGGP